MDKRGKLACLMNCSILPYNYMLLMFTIFPLKKNLFLFIIFILKLYILMLNFNLHQ